MSTTSRVRAAWRRIEDWSQGAGATQGVRLNPPASEAALAQLEATLGRRLPEAVRASYLLHDGQAGTGLLWGQRWLPLAEVQAAWRPGRQPASGSAPALRPAGALQPEVDGATRVPLAQDAAGRVELDLEPGPAGRVGQVVAAGDSQQFVVAWGWERLLEVLADQLEDGRLDLATAGGLLGAARWRYARQPDPCRWRLDRLPGPAPVRRSYAVYDLAGRLVAGPRWELLGAYGDGLAAVRIEGKTGYVDLQGQLVIEPRFSLGQRFSEGYAVVRGERGYGLIDRTGRVVCEPVWEQLGSVTNGVSVCGRGGLSGLVHPERGVLVEPCWERVYDWSEGHAVVERDGLCGLIDGQGRLVIPLVHPELYDLSEGLAAVRIGEQLGFLDTAGRVVIEPRFDAAWRFSEGLARVAVGGAFGYVRRDGSWAVEPSLGEVRRDYKDQPDTSRFVEGRAVWGPPGEPWGDEDERDEDEPPPPAERFGYLDAEGRKVTDAVFEEAASFSGGLARVSQGAHYGYLRPDGRFAIEPRFAQAGDFAGGAAVAAEHAPGPFGYLRPDGRWLVEPRYDEALPFEQGVAKVRRGKAWGLIDATGREVLAPEHELIGLPAEGRVPVATSAPDPEAAARELERVNANLAKLEQALGGTVRPFLRLTATLHPEVAFDGEAAWWEREPEALGEGWRTRSKLGGTPWLPAGTPHPTGPEGQPLFLLAQLDLGALPALPGFPDRGLLQVFGDPDGIDPDDQRSSAVEVLWHEDTAGPAAEPEPQRWDDAPLRCLASLEGALEEGPLPPSVAGFERALGRAGTQALADERTRQAYAVLCRDGGHKLGGYPLFTQEDPRSDKRYAPFQQLLLQLDGDLPGVQVGDAGMAGVFIEPARLAERDFSRVLFHTDSL